MGVPGGDKSGHGIASACWRHWMRGLGDGRVQHDAVAGGIRCAGIVVVQLRRSSAGWRRPPDVVAKAPPVKVRAISSGFEYSLALLSNSTVVAWGANQFGQLGNGTTVDTNRPFGVCAVGVKSCPPGSPSSSFLHGVTAIAAGAFFNLALVGGKVMVWGVPATVRKAHWASAPRGNTCNGGCQSVPVEVCAVGVTSCPPGSPPSSFLKGSRCRGRHVFRARRPQQQHGRVLGF